MENTRPSEHPASARPAWGTTLEELSIGIARVDLQGRLVDCNPAYAAMLGYEREELRDKPLAQLTHVRDADRDEALHARLVLGEIDQYQVEKRYVRKDGRVLWGRLTVSVSRPVDGPPFTIRVVEDITAHKRAHQRMTAQHGVARILADSATLDQATPQILCAICKSLWWDLGGLWRADPESDLLRFVDIWNEPSVEVEEFLSQTRDLTIGRGIGLPGRAWATGQPVWNNDIPSAQNFPRAEVAARVGLHGAFAFPIVLRREVLGVMDFFSREIREPDDEVLQMFATIGSQIGQFIERKRAEEDVRALAAQLSAAEDAARRTLARDIHDSIGQTLSAIKMELSGAAIEVQKAQPLPPSMSRSLGLIDSLIAQTRSLTFDLYPAMLDDLGLVPTLHRYGEQIASLAVTVSESGTRETIPMALTNYLFRATKELINNTIKHAKATTVLVALHWKRGRLRIQIVDDGRGFVPAEKLAPQNRTGLGLADLRERVRFLGGQLQIESAPGSGTQVVLEVPLGQPAEPKRDPAGFR